MCLSGARWKYQAADMWKDFLNIVEDLHGRSTQTITWAQSQSSVVSLGCEIELVQSLQQVCRITYAISQAMVVALLLQVGENFFERR